MLIFTFKGCDKCDIKVIALDVKLLYNVGALQKRLALNFMAYAIVLHSREQGKLFCVCEFVFSNFRVNSKGLRIKTCSTPTT